MQPRRQHQITRIRKPLIVSKGWIYLQCTGWGWVTPWVPETFMRGFRFGQVFIVEKKTATATRMAKKALSLLSKTTTLHVQHTFFLYIFASTARLRRENHLISSQFVEDAYVNIRQRLFFCDKVWCNVASLFKWRFRSRRRRRCLCPARKASHGTRTRLRVNRFSPDFAPDSWLAPNDHLPRW